MIDTVTGNLAVNSVFITFRSIRETKKFHIFSFFETFLYKITVSFTMVIKRSAGGESAGDGRSSSKSTCAVPTWSLTAFGDRPTSGMSKFSASVNSDLGNGSFWLQIPHAEHVDRCSWNMREFDRINWSLTSEMFTFLNMLAMVVSEAVSVPTFVLRGLRGPTATSNFFGCVSSWSL